MQAIKNTNSFDVKYNNFTGRFYISEDVFYISPDWIGISHFCKEIWNYIYNIRARDYDFCSACPEDVWDDFCEWVDRCIFALKYQKDHLEFMLNKQHKESDPIFLSYQEAYNKLTKQISQLGI